MARSPVSQCIRGLKRIAEENSFAVGVYDPRNKVLLISQPLSDFALILVATCRNSGLDIAMMLPGLVTALKVRSFKLLSTFYEELLKGFGSSYFRVVLANNKSIALIAIYSFEDLKRMASHHSDSEDGEDGGENKIEDIEDVVAKIVELSVIMGSYIILWVDKHIKLLLSKNVDELSEDEVEEFEPGLAIEKLREYLDETDEPGIPGISSTTSLDKGDLSKVIFM